MLPFDRKKNLKEEGDESGHTLALVGRRSNRRSKLILTIDFNDDTVLLHLLLHQDHFLIAFDDEVSSWIERALV